jgi:adenylosuccinate synthase
MPKATTIIGSQWGDEGKGKLIDILSREFDLCCRFNGGSNAGHTVVVEGQKYAFHLIPSGVLYPNTMCVLGHGTVIHVPTMFKELAQLDEKGIDYHGRILVSDRAHLVFEYCQQIDGYTEDKDGDKKLGTTRRGIGPTYANKMDRVGLRMGDLRDFDAFAERVRQNYKRTRRLAEFEYDVEAEIEEYREFAARLEPMIVDTVSYVNKAYASGKRILIEGANATLLDIDYGTYPFVTSSTTTIGGACTGLGLSPDKLGDVIGIVKAYTTRVGAGPFPTELHDEIGEKIRKVGVEFGTTTGRPRRCGWLDTFLLKYGHMINGFTHLNVTKLDVLSGLETLKIGTGYRLDGKNMESFPSRLGDLERVEVVYEEVPGWNEDISKVTSFDDLPKNAKAYVTRIEELVGVGVKWIGVGPGREAMIER